MGTRGRRRPAQGGEGASVQSMPEGGNETVNGIGPAVFGAATSGRVETDLAQGRQVRRQPTGPEAFPNCTCQPLLGGPPGPVIEPTQAPVTDQDPEGLGDLHQGVVVFGGGGLGAENMFQPDPVVFFGR